METLTCNISGKAQHRELLGRKFLVVGGTLINPGVLNGSQGPLLYPEDEVKRRPGDWNHVPITLYHPPAGHSARTPEVVEAQGLGFIFSTNFSKKLQSEFWFDADRVDAFDKRHKFDPPLRNRLEQGLPVDCSTGLDLERRPVENGDWRGVKYTHTTANYRPDHVAVLPDMKGACSVADGCGVNNDQPQTVLNEGGLQMALTPEQKRTIVGGLVANCGCADAPWSGKTAAQLEAMTDNELSLMDQLRQARVQAQNAAPTVVETFRDPAGNVHEKLSNGQWRSQIAQAPVAAPAQNQQQTTAAAVANGARTQSEQEWLKAAPPALAKHLERLQGYEANRRKALVDGLTVNADPGIKPALEAAYAGMDLDALEAVALNHQQSQQPEPGHAPAPAGALSFLGQGGPLAAADEPPPMLAEVTTNADYWAKKAG